MENKSQTSKSAAEEFSVEEFNVHDEPRTRLQNANTTSPNNGTGNNSHTQVQHSPAQKQNFQYSSLSSTSGQKGYLTPQQQHVKSKISDIELL